MRSEVQRGNKPTNFTSKAPFEDQKYLHPVLEDDALLYSLDDIVGSFDNECLAANGTDKTLSVHGHDAMQRVAELQEELRHLRQDFAEYRHTVDKALESRWNSEDTISENSNGATKSSAKAAVSRDNDSHYFSSYSSNGQSFWRKIEESRG